MNCISLGLCVLRLLHQIGTGSLSVSSSRTLAAIYGSEAIMLPARNQENFEGINIVLFKPIALQEGLIQIHMTHGSRLHSSQWI